MAQKAGWRGEGGGLAYNYQDAAVLRNATERFSISQLVVLWPPLISTVSSRGGEKSNLPRQLLRRAADKVTDRPVEHRTCDGFLWFLLESQIQGKY